MRFAFITTMLGAAWGGSEELWSQVAIQLSRDGHDVSALCPTCRGSQKESSQ